jgi:hypothetical protein
MERVEAGMMEFDVGPENPDEVADEVSGSWCSQEPDVGALSYLLPSNARPATSRWATVMLPQLALPGSSFIAGRDDVR